MDNAPIEALRDRLTGALIGLARATDGNEHLITPASTAAVLEGLAAVQAGSDPAALSALLARITDEKRRMVPDCFACASPCGKNNDYDMNNLRRAPEDVRTAKNQLLSGICALAVSPHRDNTLDRFLYKALIVIGMDDFDAEELLPITAELEEWNRRYLAL